MLRAKLTADCVKMIARRRRLHYCITRSKDIYRILIKIENYEYHQNSNVKIFEDGNLK
jgi:hypothetical protein